MRTRALIAGGIVAAAAFVASPAAAESDHAGTLQKICEAKGGIFVPRPGWWQARCQGARESQAPFMICTMQMAGDWFSITNESDGTTNWICF